MPKVTSIKIRHEGTAFNQASLERAFDWIRQQMSSTDLSSCSNVVLESQVGDTSIEFKLSDTKEPVQKELNRVDN